MKDKIEFLWMVKTTLERNPGLMAETVEAIQEGLLSKIETQNQLRVDAETAVMVLSPYIEKLKNEGQKQTCARVVSKSWCLGGTPFAKQLEEECLLQSQLKA